MSQADEADMADRTIMKEVRSWSLLCHRPTTVFSASRTRDSGLR